MAKQLDNSFFIFSRPASVVVQTAVAMGLVLLLIVGLVIAWTSSAWPLAAVLGLSVVGVIAYTAISIEQNRRLAAAKKQYRIVWESSIPEIQRENLNVEVRELARVLDVSADQSADLQSAYIVAEDLALRQIQNEEGVPLLRHVCVGGVPFDAAMVRHNVLTCCDVSFLVTPELRQEKVDAAIRKITKVNNVMNSSGIGFEVRLMIILVTQLTDGDRERLLETSDKKRFAATPVDIDIRLLDFETLQGIYVTEI